MRTSIFLALFVVLAAALPASSRVQDAPAGSSKLKPLTAAPGVLAPGNPPLTEPMVGDMAEALGRLTGSPLTSTETDRLRQRALTQWKRGVAYQDSIRAAHARLKKDLDKVSTFPVAAQAAAWDERARILREEIAAAPESFLFEVYNRAVALASEPVSAAKPMLTKSAGQAFFEMRDYFEDLVENFESRPTATETLRGGVEIGKQYASWPDATRERVARADRVWAVARAKIGAMTPEAKAALAATTTKAAARDGARDGSGRLTPDAVWEVLTTAGLTTQSPAAYWAAMLGGM